MEETSLNKTVVITNAETAQALADLSELRSLLPFFFNELTLSEAAEVLGLKLNTMHYRAKRLVSLGLSEVASEEPRKGRAMKRYRATSSDYFVPFEATAAGTLETLFAQLRAETNALYNRNATHTLLEIDGVGLRVSAKENHNVSAAFDTVDGSLLAKDALEAREPAVIISNMVLRLEYDRAKSLQRDLQALLETYNKREQTGQEYVQASRRCTRPS